MKIRIEIGEGAGTNKELNWRWLDRLVKWWIIRSILKNTDKGLVNQSQIGGDNDHR